MCPPASSPSRDLLGQLLGGLHCQDGLVADAITAAVGQLLDYIKQNGVAGAVRLAERGAKLITGLNAAQASIDAVDKCSDLNDAGAHNSRIAGYISLHTVIADAITAADASAGFLLGDVFGAVVGAAGGAIIAGLIADYASTYVHDVLKRAYG